VRRMRAGNNKGATSWSLCKCALAKLDISTAPWLHPMPWRYAQG
jgi:hypothetical protein